MEDQIFNLFTDKSVILRPLNVARLLNIEKKEANKHLHSLMEKKKLSVTRTKTGGDPQYQLGSGEVMTAPSQLEGEDVLNLLAEGEATAPVLASKILGNDRAAAVTAVNSELYSLQRKGKVIKRVDPKSAFPIWSVSDE